MAHDLVVREFPTQFSPQSLGVGFVHVRDRVWVPLLQLTSHADQADQDAHPPSSGEISIVM